jgi:hypothetical protein
MHNGTWECATTTGEVWIETLHRRARGSEKPRRKDILWLLELCSRVTRENIWVFGKCLLVLRMLALRRPDTQRRTSLRGW